MAHVGQEGGLQLGGLLRLLLRVAQLRLGALSRRDVGVEPHEATDAAVRPPLHRQPGAVEPDLALDRMQESKLLVVQLGLAGDVGVQRGDHAIVVVGVQVALPMGVGLVTALGLQPDDVEPFVRAPQAARRPYSAPRCRGGQPASPA